MGSWRLLPCPVWPQDTPTPTPTDPTDQRLSPWVAAVNSTVSATVGVSTRVVGVLEIGVGVGAVAEVMEPATSSGSAWARKGLVGEG